MGLLSLVDKFYPRAQWPTPAKVRGLGAWGGVVVAAGFFIIQPFDWLDETLGMKKQEQ